MKVRGAGVRRGSSRFSHGGGPILCVPGKVREIADRSLQTHSVEVIVQSDPHRGFGGGQIGYNALPFPHLLFGVEGDFDWADLTGTPSACSATGCISSNHKTDWISTLRVRMGYVQDNWLFYGTGGFAWTHGSTTRTIVISALFPTLAGTSASASGQNTGWTLGGGVEYGFWRNWSVNVEYRYMQVDRSRDYYYPIPAANRHFHYVDDTNTVRVGLNYHFN